MCCIDYEALKPRLDVLLAAHREDLKIAASIEQRSASLIKRYATHVRIKCYLSWFHGQF